MKIRFTMFDEAPNVVSVFIFINMMVMIFLIGIGFAYLVLNFGPKVFLLLLIFPVFALYLAIKKKYLFIERD